jgi:hypothetical protein
MGPSSWREIRGRAVLYLFLLFLSAMAFPGIVRAQSDYYRPVETKIFLNPPNAARVATAAGPRVGSGLAKA